MQKSKKIALVFVLFSSISQYLAKLRRLQKLFVSAFTLHRMMGVTRYLLISVRGAMQDASKWQPWLMPLIRIFDDPDPTRTIWQGPEELSLVGVFLILKLAWTESPAGLRICRLPDRLSTPLAVPSALFTADSKTLPRRAKRAS